MYHPSSCSIPSDQVSGKQKIPEAAKTSGTYETKTQYDQPMIVSILFSHPDFTVGSGNDPDLPFGSRALPPVRNYTYP